MSFYKQTLDADGPDEFATTSDKYIQRHRELYILHRNAEDNDQHHWLREHGHLHGESRHHLEYDYGLARQEIVAIERETYTTPT